ncbi:MAG: cytochrome c oxidase assembly factor Coa1 family protein [Planctomycetia bacterium]|nr:cytochrome c oxidase assembly factor Coa1 family protein [Planctomycetia bacterium]
MSNPYAFPVAEPRQRSWFGRNWWWVLLVALALFLLICCGVCGGFFLTGVTVFKNSEPYQLALEKVKQDPEVVKRLGEPIEDGFIPQGNVNINNDRGDATLNFDVTGPNGTAHVMSQSRLINGKWGLTQLGVTFDDGQRITIDTVGGGDANDPGEAPPWKP